MLTYKMITHVGNREHNEDSLACTESGGNYCFVVADGLGGHGRGELASKKATEVIAREFSQGAKNSFDFLNKSLSAAQSEILDMQQAMNDRLGMKTTAVCLSIIDGKCQWGHIGDSRLYIFKKNKIIYRTLDHSVPQMLALSGEIKDKHIPTHPDRNRLLRVMGVEWDSPRYEISDEELPLADCQAFLLCTDGFWELIDPKKMCRFLKKSGSAEEWLSKMIAEVEKNGQGNDMDNYTAIAVLAT